MGGTITVWGLNDAWGLPDVSPFVTKLELWLQLCALPYEKRYLQGPVRSKNGKIPWVDLEDGRRLEDTSHIIEILSAERGIDLDAHLDARRRTRATLVKRTVEDHLYFALVYRRWADQNGYQTTRETYFTRMPSALRGPATLLARRGALKNLRGHGLGRMDSLAVQKGAVEDIKALAAGLGDDAFFGGDRVAVIDATCAAFLMHIKGAPYPGPTQDALKAEPNLLGYLDRVRGLCAPTRIQAQPGR